MDPETVYPSHHEGDCTISWLCRCLRSGTCFSPFTLYSLRNAGVCCETCLPPVSRRNCGWSKHVQPRVIRVLMASMTSSMLFMSEDATLNRRIHIDRKRLLLTLLATIRLWQVVRYCGNPTPSSRRLPPARHSLPGLKPSCTDKAVLASHGTGSTALWSHDDAELDHSKLDRSG